MSAIYGYIQKRESFNDGYFQALDVWNRDYGEKRNLKREFSGVALGCRVNQIREDVNVEREVLCEGNRYYGVCDALIYNREELIEKLEECLGNTQYEELERISDERLLFLTFLNRGTAGLKEINGDFSGAIFDEKERILTVFRDHLGIRPLFIYEDDTNFAFATDYRGFLAMPEVDSSISEAYLYMRLTQKHIWDDELTDFECIRAVRPGTIIKYSQDTQRKETYKYWKLGEKRICFKTEEEYIKEMRHLVEDSIKRRLSVFRGTVGAELSGGLDSTVIDVMIKKTGRDAVFCSWSPNLKIFPIQKLDERENIEQTCRKFNIKCDYIDMKWLEDEEEQIKNLEEMLPVDIDGLLLKKSMEYFEEKNVHVAFSGWGGDEGVSHRANAFELWYHREYLDYLKLWWSRTEGEKLRIFRFGKRVLRNLIQTRKRMMRPWDFYTFNEIGYVSILKEDFEERNKNILKNIPMYFAYAPIKQIESGGNRRRTESVAVYGSQKGVQYVFPFLDYRVEDYAVSIPRKYFLRGNCNRYIYREAFREELGEHLYHYRDKDDSGRSTYYKQYTEKKVPLICDYIFCRLNKEYWSKYLDYEKLQQLNDKEWKNNNGIYIMQMLMRCYRIQLLQNHASEYVRLHADEESIK